MLRKGCVTVGKIYYSTYIISNNFIPFLSIPNFIIFLFRLLLLFFLVWWWQAAMKYRKWRRRVMCLEVSRGRLDHGRPLCVCVCVSPAGVAQRSLVRRGAPSPGVLSAPWWHALGTLTLSSLDLRVTWCRVVLSC